MKIAIYQLDAFTDHLFGGNPAAVCKLDDWLPDDILQAIAAENNLSETAFITPREGNYHIRWFTPTTEVDLCGHATLAAGFVILNKLEPKREGVMLYSLSGQLMIERNAEGYFSMDFPALELSMCEPPDLLTRGLGITPVECYRSKDYLAVLPSEKIIRSLNPDFSSLRELDLRGVIVTAKGEHTDFVSRFFTPQKGVNEDPVTGSAHCALTPYWAERLGKNNLHGRQLSKRQGDVYCELRGNRVILQGRVVPYLEGVIELFNEHSL